MYLTTFFWIVELSSNQKRANLSKDTPYPLPPIQFGIFYIFAVCTAIKVHTHSMTWLLTKFNLCVLCVCVAAQACVTESEPNTNLCPVMCEPSKQQIIYNQDNLWKPSFKNFYVVTIAFSKRALIIYFRH